nr:hypothetical protein [Oligoflexales bacterium]
MSSPLLTTLQKNLGISEAILKKAQEQSEAESISLFAALELANAAPIEKLLDFFSAYYKVQKVDLDNKPIPPQILELIPSELAQKLKVIPLDKVGNNIFIAMANPLDLE